MKIEISKTIQTGYHKPDGTTDVYDVRYSSNNGKRQQSGFIGTVHLVDGMYVFMFNSGPVNVMSKISDMDKIIFKMYKVKPTYVHTLFNF